MKNWIMITLCFLSVLSGMAGETEGTLAGDSLEQKKKGWTFGALPAVTYNSDLGLQYGALANFFYYGNGNSYPKYLHSLYFEVSRFTKGSGINQFFYDSEYLIPGVRVTFDASYLTEKALPFYGFNGAEAQYYSSWEDDGADDYVSRMFYRHERAITRFTADFQGRLHSKNWRWLVGAGHFNYALATVDVDALNKGLKSGDKLPDVPTLYDKYVDWGVISPSERKGGMVNYLKGGVIYDTRDLEANPTQGMWSEALLFYGADWLGSDSHYLKLVLTHRHYFTLIPERLTLACRGMWQGTVAGDVPFYMEPYGISSYSKLAFTDMLGGARSVRGTLRNRVVGSGFALLNIEPRWKVFRTVVKKQNLYFALSTFLDAGMVTNQRSVEVSGVPDEERSALFNDAGDNVHMSVGAGLHIALNENFVLAIDYGKALRAADGKDGLYINLGFLF